MHEHKIFALAALIGSLTFYPHAWSENLEQIVKLALNNHPQALIELSKVKGAGEKIDVAWASYLPSVDIALGAGGQRRKLPEELQSNKTHDKNYTRKEGSIAFKQNLFSGFNTMQTVSQAKHLTDAAKYSLGRTLEELALQVTNAYLKVLEHREFIEFAEDNIKLHDKIYELIKKRTEQGVARSSDLVQIKGRQARANANLLNAHNNLADAKSEYFSLVGKIPSEKMPPPPIADLPLPENIESALALMVKNHPTLLAFDYKIKAAEADYRAQKSSYFPSLDLTVDQNWKNNADGNLGTYEDLQVMFKLKYNIFKGGADIAMVNKSAFKMEEDRAEKARALRSVTEALQLAWHSHEFLKEKIIYLREHEQATREIVNVYQEQFYIGKRTLLDLLDTENELFQASQNLMQATYEEAYARYRILSSTGQLLDVFNLSWGKGWYNQS